MTREEEIKKESKNRYPYIKGLPQTSANQEIFIESAKWADETMIEKAEKWLKEKNKMCMYELEMILGRNFIEDFKKAMKGE